MTKFQNMKIRIKDAEHSRQVQECLFELGYSWPTGIRDIKNLHYKFLYPCNQFAPMQIEWGNSEGYFLQDQSAEVTLEDLQAMLAEQSEEVMEQPDVNFNPEHTISTYIKQLQQLLKDSRTAIYIYENEIRVCNMCNDDEAIVESWDEVAEVLKIKQQYLSKFKE